MGIHTRRDCRSLGHSYMLTTVLPCPRPLRHVISSAAIWQSAVFLADIDVVSVDWGLGLLGVLQLLVVLLVMYVIDPIGRKPLLAGGENHGRNAELLVAAD